MAWFLNEVIALKSAGAVSVLWWYKSSWSWRRFIISVFGSSAPSLVSRFRECEVDKFQEGVEVLQHFSFVTSLCFLLVGAFAHIVRRVYREKCLASGRMCKSIFHSFDFDFFRSKKEKQKKWVRNLWGIFSKKSFKSILSFLFRNIKLSRAPMNPVRATIYIMSCHFLCNLRLPFTARLSQSPRRTSNQIFNSSF